MDVLVLDCGGVVPSFAIVSPYIIWLSNLHTSLPSPPTTFNSLGSSFSLSGDFNRGPCRNSSFLINGVSSPSISDALAWEVPLEDEKKDVRSRTFKWVNFEVAEEAGPSAGGPSKAVMDHEITQSRNDGTLRNIKPLNTLEPCHQVKQLENTDARSNSKPEYLDVIRTVQADTDPVIQKKRGRESNSLIKMEEGYNNSWTSERRKSLKEPSCMKNYKKKVGSSTKSSNSEQSALRQEDRETNSCNVSSKASHLESTSDSASQHVSHTH